MNKKIKIEFVVPYAENQLEIKLSKLKDIEELDLLILDFFIDNKKFPKDQKLIDSLQNAFNLNSKFKKFLENRIFSLYEEKNLLLSNKEKEKKYNKNNKNLKNFLKGDFEIHPNLEKNLKKFIFKSFQNETKNITIWYYEDLIFNKNSKYFNKEKKDIQLNNEIKEIFENFYNGTYNNYFEDKLINSYKNDKNKIQDIETNFSENLLNVLNKNENEEISLIKNVSQNIFLDKKDFDFLISFEENKNILHLKNDDKDQYEYFKFLNKNNLIEQYFYSSFQNQVFKKNKFNDLKEINSINNEFIYFWEINDDKFETLLKNFEITKQFIKKYFDLSFYKNTFYEIKIKKETNVIYKDENDKKFDFKLFNITVFKEINNNENINTFLNDENWKIYFTKEFENFFNQLNIEFQTKVLNFLIKNLENANLEQFLDENNFYWLIAKLKELDKLKIFNFLFKDENLYVLEKILTNKDLSIKNIGIETLKHFSINNLNNISINKLTNFNFTGENEKVYSEICEIFKYKSIKPIFKFWNKLNYFENDLKKLDFSTKTDIEDLENIKSSYIKIINKWKKEKCFDISELNENLEKIEDLILNSKRKLKTQILELSTDINHYLEKILDMSNSKDNFYEKLKEKKWDKYFENLAKELKKWRNDIAHVGDKQNKIETMNKKEFLKIKDKFNELKKYIENKGV
ncbi:hypothetical protein [[Mycoplasma] collis]|uniref:hypothetical protein n=1 Tax=[Mycoplasma] collis TaxID=2127 RepID=UPI00051C74B4|nr:hypothetical protein [[Mycoplasma] collis]